MNAINTSVGKQIQTKNGRIAGVVACLPTHEISNDYFIEKFGAESVKDVVKMIAKLLEICVIEPITYLEKLIR